MDNYLTQFMKQTCHKRVKKTMFFTPFYLTYLHNNNRVLFKTIVPFFRSTQFMYRMQRWVKRKIKPCQVQGALNDRADKVFYPNMNLADASNLIQ